MLFAFVLAVFTVAGWVMTPKLRKLSENQVLGWTFHILGIVGVYMLAATVMLYSDISVATLSYYYVCLGVVGGVATISIGLRIFLNRNVKAKDFEVATS